jgi:hypothetical protein
MKNMFKNVTFAIGLLLLIIGALTLDYPDWDIGVSVVMAGTTYLTAEYAVLSIYNFDVKRFPASIFFTWLSVDGVYWLYHSLAGNLMIREGQWPASLCLYLLCGIIWTRGQDISQCLRLSLNTLVRSRIN